MDPVLWGIICVQLECPALGDVPCDAEMWMD